MNVSVFVLLNGSKAECFQTELNSADQRLLRDKLVAPQKYEKCVNICRVVNSNQITHFLDFLAIVAMSVVLRAKLVFPFLEGSTYC